MKINGLSDSYQCSERLRKLVKSLYMVNLQKANNRNKGHYIAKERVVQERNHRIQLNPIQHLHTHNINFLIKNKAIK